MKQAIWKEHFVEGIPLKRASEKTSTDFLSLHLLFHKYKKYKL